MTDTNDLKNTDELNTDELNKTNKLNEPNQPRDVSEPTEPGKTGLRDVCSYAVIVNTQPRSGNEDITTEGVYTNFRDAVTNLKSARLDMEDGWIAPTDRDTRAAYPYPNKIGAIWSEDQFLGWGYAWFDPRGRGSVNRVWIARIRDDETIPSYDSADERDLLDDTSNIDLVAFGQQLPGNAMFDEDSQDVIFPGEEEQDGEEDGLVQHGGVEDDPAELDFAWNELAMDEITENELRKNELEGDEPEANYFYKQYREGPEDDQEEIFDRGSEEVNDHEDNDYEEAGGEDYVHEDWDDEYELRKLHQRGF
jgi:hypothetical protein